MVKSFGMHLKCVAYAALTVSACIATPSVVFAQTDATGAVVNSTGTTAAAATATDWSKVDKVSLYRLYNPNSGEHFYTLDVSERNNLMSLGWRYEGVGWIAPTTSNVPVYRLYNPNAGDHHYTTSAAERDMLTPLGWIYEGIGWYSGGTVNILRQYNPNAYTGTHNFTANQAENDHLASIGWHAEGISWQAIYGQNELIMGASTTSVAQMKAAYNASGKTYPANVYTQYGAATINDFCQILLEEAKAEGVRAEVVFAQSMHETGWLAFGGDVKTEQCNFAGLGATGGGNPGNSFNTYGKDSVRMGLRAQIQHLKAYASTAPLNQSLIDQRFKYVKRGIAPDVMSLGGTWAVPGKEYGPALISIMNNLATR